jgi:uncharacterized OsmC-like protein
MTSKVTYQGQLRTTSVHLASGNEITSDAPIDNHGKGEAFSPTDFVANALAACMFTVMGIKAAEKTIDLTGSYAEVTKIMAAEPRRIGEIVVEMYLPQNLDEKSRLILERTAKTCPVHHSLHPDLVQNIHFHYTL